jgi:hypothetical protein
MDSSSSSHPFDVASSLPCRHIHESFWKKGWVDAVVEQITNCPCNPGGCNIFCVHSLYSNPNNSPTKYLESLNCSWITIRRFQVTQIVANLLDTTRRVVEKWNVNLGNSSNLAQSRGILLENQGRVSTLPLPLRKKAPMFLLIEETKNRLALYPPRDGEVFLKKYWEPVRSFNARLQLSVREKILQETLSGN